MTWHIVKEPFITPPGAPPKGYHYRIGSTDPDGRTRLWARCGTQEQAEELVRRLNNYETGWAKPHPIELPVPKWDEEPPEGEW